MTQQHRIQELQVELTGNSEGKARQLQQELGQFIQQRIAPLIDRFCSEACPPDQLIRMDTLKLDLGELDPQRFKLDFEAKVRRKLPTKLKQAIQKTPKVTTQAETQFELLEYFVQTGMLPWWADAQNSALIEESIQLLLKKAPEKLRTLLLKYIRQENRMIRLLSAVAQGVAKNMLQLLKAKAGSSEQLLVQSFEEIILQRTGKGKPSDKYASFSSSQNTILESPVGQDAAKIAFFNDVEELYIHNAGLVLLWPFLPSFFEKVALIKDKQFQDAGKIQQAMILLEYLATGAKEPKEYQLPLNKVLCGLPLDAVFEPNGEMDAHFFEEADKLLEAVLIHAEGLGTISVDGFRRTFLQRQGILSFQDGHWLLQVNRETYDLLLGSLPWSFRIAKLPWMDFALMVDW